MRGTGWAAKLSYPSTKRPFPGSPGRDSRPDCWPRSLSGIADPVGRFCLPQGTASSDFWGTLLPQGFSVPRAREAEAVAWRIRGKEQFRAVTDQIVKNMFRYLQVQYLRLRSRRDAKKAICAAAASILTAAYHMLKNGTFYDDPANSQRFVALDHLAQIDELTSG
jgi:hypothetical protein